MNNKNAVHLFIAIRRKKENPNLKEFCIRHIIRDNENPHNDLNILKTIINNQNDGAIWRIYKTINARDTKIAMKIMQHKMIDNPEICNSLISTWKTVLMQPKCKTTNHILIDVDTKDKKVIFKITQKLLQNTYINFNPTPNGYHLVYKNQDVREIEKIDKVEVKRDALMFYFLHKNKRRE